MLHAREKFQALRADGPVSANQLHTLSMLVNVLIWMKNQILK